MPHGKTILIKQKKKKVGLMGRQVEIKYKHPTQEVREGKGGGPEVKCKHCESWVELKNWWVHTCKGS